MKGLVITYSSPEDSKLAEYLYLIEADIDPEHNDIHVNGYGISISHAKTIRDWFNKAIKEVNKNKSKKHKKKAS